MCLQIWASLILMTSLILTKKNSEEKKLPQTRTAEQNSKFWRREWQLTPAFLPGTPHEQRCLVCYSPRGCKGSDATKPPTLSNIYVYSSQNTVLNWLQLPKQKPIEVIKIREIQFNCLKHTWRYLLSAGYHWPLEIQKCEWYFHADTGVSTLIQTLTASLDTLLLSKEYSQRHPLTLGLSQHLYLNNN